MRHRIILVDESQEQIGFAHCGVADYHDLCQVVVVCLFWLCKLTFQSVHTPPYTVFIIIPNTSLTHLKSSEKTTVYHLP